MARSRNRTNQQTINKDLFLSTQSQHHLPRFIYNQATIAANMATTEPAAGMVMAEPALTAAEDDAELDEEEVVVLVS